MTEKVVWHVVKQYARELGVLKLVRHDLRRSCARLFHSAGGELEQNQFLVYVLHYVGEGYWKVWHDGKLVEIDDFPDKVSKPKTTWWVKLKTSSGAIGWTIEHGNFENQDACG